jgi:hypothetical protein
MYFQALERFLDFVAHVRLHSETPDGHPAQLPCNATLDVWLAFYFSYDCFRKYLHVNQSQLTLAAVLYLVPELKGSFPLAGRSLSAYLELLPGKERGPWDRDGVAAVAAVFLLQGDDEAALIVLFCFGTMARAQDWSRLHVEDVAFSGDTAGIKFGARGERAKTGYDQGFDLIGWTFLVNWLRRQCRQRGHGKVFSLSTSAFRHKWKVVVDALQFPDDPPHVLRHSGASFRYAVLHQSLPEIMRIGRWRALSSVQRYTKSWLCAHFRAAVSDEWLRLGHFFWHQPGRFLVPP